MNILVLIPTYKKSIDDIKKLFEFLNIQTDVVFANQCGKNEVINLTFKNHKLTVVCSDTVGVSVNRNILLNNAYGDINVFIDDDCPLIDGFQEKILDFYSKNSADCCIFNGIWSTHNNKKIHNKTTRKITRFNQISYAGGPGFTCTKKFSTNNKIRYNQKVGTPNYICAGEDSLFYYSLVKDKVNLYRSSEVIFNVAIDEDNSSYFNGIDEQYVTTRGYITKKIHPYLFFVYKYRHAFRFIKQGTTLSFCEILKCLHRGAVLFKKENI